MKQGNDNNTDNNNNKEQEFYVILAGQAAGKDGVAAEISAGGEELLAEDGIIAGNDKEGHLEKAVGAGDLHSAGLLAGFSDNQGFKAIASEQKVGADSFAFDPAGGADTERGLIRRHVPDAIGDTEDAFLTGGAVGIFPVFLSDGIGQRFGNRDKHGHCKAGAFTHDIAHNGERAEQFDA